jgi:hypothetical protein
VCVERDLQGALSLVDARGDEEGCSEPGRC